MSRYRALVTCRQLQETIEPYRPRFEKHDIQIVLPTIVQQLSESQLLEIIADYDGIIAGDDEITERVLRKGKRLKVVSKWGIGVDGIDREAAERLGIPVYNTPGVFGDEVADAAMGYVLLLARQLHRLDSAVRKGDWLKVRGVSLRGKKAGIVGLGSIGRSVARRAAAFGMSVTGYDPIVLDSAEQAELRLRQASLEEVLTKADFVIITAPLTAETRHMFDGRAFERMKPGAFLVNVARGGLVQESALIAALAQGRLAGAALDVFETEPLPEDSPLLRFENLIFGTHNGSNTHEGVLRTNDLAIDNLLRGLGISVS